MGGVAIATEGSTVLDARGVGHTKHTQRITIEMIEDDELDGQWLDFKRRELSARGGRGRSRNREKGGGTDARGGIE